MAQAVLQRAIDEDAERQQVFWKNVEVAVQNGVARAFGAR